MTAKFKTVKWKNFLATGNEWQEFRLDGADIRLITGKNGAGKSTLLDAITFALFKKPVRKVKLAQLINSINKKDTVVEIEFEDASGHQYKVVRGLKPNLFEIHRDGELLPVTSDIDDYQSNLEKNILRLNFKTFKQVDILSSTGYIPFMELSAGDRRAVVEDLLDGRVYGLMSKLAKTELDEHNKSMARLNIEIESMERQERTLVSTISSLSSVNPSNSDAISIFKNEISNQEGRIKQFQSSIEEKRQIINGLHQQVSAIPVELDVAREAYDAMHEKVRDTDSDVHRKTTYINKFTGIGVCESCQQDVPDSHKENVRTKTTEQIEQLKIQSATLRKRLTKLSDIVAQHNALARDIASHNEKIRELETEIRVCNNAISQSKRALEVELNRPEVVDNTDEVDRQKKELDSVVDQLAAARDKYNNAAKQAQILKKAIAVCSDSGIKAKIVSKYLDIINGTINYYLQKMDMFVDLQLDDQFNETIKARYRDDFSYESFSMGQKARIDLAILLTWRKIAQIRNSVASNILIFDEAFDGSLDNDARSELLEILQILNEENITVIVISHNETHKQTFPKVLEVSLEGNFSVYNELK